jgi:recombination associated protein RdgC
VFKNARFFRLIEPRGAAAEELEERLSSRRFRPCGPAETMTLGWYPPFGDEEGALVHAANGCLLLCARRQERLLPSSVVAEAVDEKVAELEDREGRSVGRAERRRLREEVTIDLLPRAFTRSRQVRAYMDPVAAWMLVDAASEKGAEEVVSLLRETLGSLPVRPPRPERATANLMTQWIAEGQTPAGLILEDECELRDAQDERSVVRCRGQDLRGEEISTHLRAGKQAVKLALSWRERLSFVLQEDVSLKRLRFADALIDEALEPEIEDEAARFDAEFAIMALEMRELLACLGDAFGLTGEA